MIQALASGTIDVYVAGVAPLAVARTKNIDVRVVASTAVEEMVFVAGPKLAPFFANRREQGRGLRAVQGQGGSLRAARHPAPRLGAQHHPAALAVAGGEDRQGQCRGGAHGHRRHAAGNPRRRRRRRSIREPALTIVQGRNPGVKLIANGAEMFPDQPGTVVGVYGAYADRNPGAVESLVRSLIRADTLLKSDSAKAAPHVLAALGKGIVDLATIQKALTSPAAKFTVDPRAIIVATKAMQAYQVSIGALEKDVPLDGLVRLALLREGDRALIG